MDGTNYLATWADELLARANRVRQLIGDAHWLSDGHHKESLIREFLVRHIANRFQVARGFVCPTEAGMCCSPEIDILICDPSLHPPLFFEGALQIAVPSSVVAYLEIKSSLSKETLRDAIAGQIATQSLLERYSDARNVWRGILIADSPASRTLESVVDTIADVLNDFPSLLETMPKAFTCRPDKLDAKYLPRCIATFDRFVIFLVPDYVANSCQLKAFDTTRMGLACALSDLFSSLSVRFGGMLQPAEIMALVESAVSSAPLIRNLTFA